MSVPARSLPKKPINACPAKAAASCRALAAAARIPTANSSFPPNTGGWLPNYLGPETTIDYIEKLDRILVSYGAHENIYMPSDEIKLECLKYDLRLLQARVKHLGTDGNFKTMSRLIADLATKVDIFTNEDVTDIDEVKRVVHSDKDEYSYKKLVIAVGRVGSGWFGELCHKKGIPVANNQVDIGVRVELPRLVWRHISKVIYEPKILYRTKKYGDICRMFCFNDGGEVVMENSDGIMTVNGMPTTTKPKKRRTPTLRCFPPSTSPSLLKNRLPMPSTSRT